MLKTDVPNKNMFVVVVGPMSSKGGITSVITSHSRMATWNSFGCKRLNTYDDGGFISKVATAVLAYLRAPLLLRGCSIVHVHMAGGSSMARKLPILLLAKTMGKSIVVHLHAPSMAGLLSQRPKWLFRATCRLANCIVALSPWWAQQLSAGGIITPVRVIPNPVTLPAEPSRHQDEGEPPIILFVGKIEARKGYSDLIKAAAIVLRHVPDTQFILVGHGALKEAVALSRLLGIERSIQLPGWLEGDALMQRYREATLFCLPSYNEGLPMSVLEAMSWGLPVVTTPVGGIPDLLKNGKNGVLVKPGHIFELASALTTLLSLPEEERRSIGSQARSTVLHSCDPAEISNKLAELYFDLLRPFSTLSPKLRAL